MPAPENRVQAELWACQKLMEEHAIDSPEWTRAHDIQQAIMWVIDPTLASPVTAAFRRWPHPYANLVSMAAPSDPLTTPQQAP